MRRLIGFTLCALLAACSSSPTSPSGSPGVPTPSGPYALTGRVLALQTGQALGGVTVDTSSSDGSGDYTLTLPAGTQALTLTGAGIVSRKLWVSLSGPRTLDLHPIALAGFDLGFYQEFVRGKLDNATLQPLRRLTAAPQVYLRTVDDNGQPIDTATLDMVETAIRQAAPIWSGGSFGVAGVSRGTDTKKGVSGWLTVEWVPSLGHCGVTDVGTSGGVMRLDPSRRCTCGSPYAVAPTVVAHELGHAFGFWHTDSSRDLMYQGTLVCGTNPSAREQAAAKIAYARPVGNTDPDDDPSSAVKLTALRIP